jgi:hypothetical protein
MIIQEGEGADLQSDPLPTARRLASQVSWAFGAPLAAKLDPQFGG